MPQGLDCSTPSRRPQRKDAGRRFRGRRNPALPPLVFLFVALHMVLRAAGETPAELSAAEQRFMQARRSGDMALIAREGDRFLDILERNSPQDQRIREVLTKTAAVYDELQNYEAACQRLEKAKEFAARNSGTNSPAYATVLRDLAMTIYRSGKAQQACLMMQEAQAIIRSLHGETSAEFADSLLGSAMIHETLGDLARAEENYEKVRRIYEKTLPPTHPHRMYFHKNLADFLDRRGDYEGAAKSLSDAVDIIRASGERSVNVMHDVLSSAGMVLRHRGDYTGALAKYEECIRLSTRMAGPESPAVASDLANVASIHTENGNYAKAREYLAASIDVYVKRFGPNYRINGVLYNDMGCLLTFMGDREGAARMLAASLDITAREQGTNHPSYANTLANVAVLHANSRELASAVARMDEANSVYERVLRNMMGVGTESQKLPYLRRIEGKTFFALWLGVANPGDQGASRLALTTCLQRKGIVADALADTYGTARRRLTGQARADFDALLQIRGELSRSTFGRSRSNRENLARLDEQATELERKLSRSAAAIRGVTAPATPEDVRKALPEGAVLLEFVRFRPYDPAVPKALNHTIEPHYAVCPVTASGWGPWVDLGKSGAIDRQIVATRTAAGIADGTPPDVPAQALYRLLLKPVEYAIRGRKLLLVSPDAALHVVPFGALKDESGQFLVERIPVSAVCSGRDLLDYATPPSATTRDIVVLADPDYDGTSVVSKSPVLGPRSRDTRRFRMKRLPGTRGELNDIMAIFPQTLGYSGARASEGWLKSLNSPRILHLASHGFFLPDQAFEYVRVPMGVGPDVIYAMPREPENPLVRSGIALTGANFLADGAEDGVLTALEASGLNLEGTELVVLSACDTGLGDVAPGEGVFGLRRCFQIAGARSVIMTLWPVDDEAARLLMKGFYTNLAGGLSRAEALRSAQLAMLKGKFAHPSYWAAFTLCGDWRPMFGAGGRAGNDGK